MTSRTGHQVNRRPARCVLAFSCLMLVLAGRVHAAPIAVVNPGFEDITGETPVDEFTFGPLNGWDLYDPNGVTNGGAGGTFFIGTLTPFEPDPIGNPGVFANFPAGAPEGQRVGIAFNFAGSDGDEYGFQQTLAATVQANMQYTLQVGIGNIDSATATSGQFFDLQGFPGYRVDLLAGGVVLAQDINSLGGTIPDGEFATSTVVFSTGASPAQLGQNLAIRLVNLNVVDPAFPGSDLEVDFDDVQLSALAVPIPSSLPLVALMLAGFVVRGRRHSVTDPGTCDRRMTDAIDMPTSEKGSVN